jgi:hypothetical protein
LPAESQSLTNSKPGREASSKTRQEIRKSFTISLSLVTERKMESNTGKSETHGEPTTQSRDSSESSEVLITSPSNQIAHGPSPRTPGLTTRSTQPLRKRRKTPETKSTTRTEQLHLPPLNLSLSTAPAAESRRPRSNLDRSPL